MKNLKYFTLGIMLLSVCSYGADTVYGSDTDNEASKAIAAISACYNNSVPNYCLGKISDKEEASYKTAYSSLIKSLVDIGNSNGSKLALELKHSKPLWESSLQRDCRARGLIYDDGSEAYDGNVAACEAVQYARRVDFYNGFGISANAEDMKNLLKEYNKTHPEK